WKTAERPPTACPGWSIVFRLALCYSLGSVLLFGALGAFLYHELRQSLQAEGRAVLADKIAVLREIVRERPHDRAALEEEIKWESAARKHATFYGRLVDSGGGVALSSPGAETLLPDPQRFPLPASPGQALGPVFRWHQAGRVFLLTSARADGAGGDAYTYQLGLDVSGVERILDGFRLELLLALMILAGLSAALGTWVARFGMRPVEEITRAAQRVTVNALNDCISARAWPRELAALAREFDGMLRRLEEAFGRLSQFSADLAHELRTPLHNLMGEAQWALARPRSPDDYRRVLRSSVEECERLGRMADSLLFLARADNAGVTVQRTEFAIRKIVQPLLEFFEPWANENGVRLLCSGDAALQADPELFRRLLSNLLANALRHTPKGGRIEVSCEAQTGATILSVQDTGEGIAPEHLPRLFDRFYRVEPARTRHGGTGLGLALCKKIVELHGGTIRVESAVGQGTRVCVVFPRTSTAPT
ncbi:MAG: heavy metal sensor histidine kinase, partial [Verrucomicrobia bacterium]|nr:heavy metal sensor histidine kinase [Verrucomicrobiota bacterium]